LQNRSTEKWQHTASNGKLYVKGLFYQFVHDLLRQIQNETSILAKVSTVEQIARYLRDHYEQPISLEEISVRFNYSSRYLSKLFKKEMNQGLIEYLIKYRITRAQELLLRTNLPVREIARSVGYADLFYFIRLFKKISQTTPHLYRLHGGTNAKGVDDAYGGTTLSIELNAVQTYIVDEDENHYQYKEGDMEAMFNWKVRAKAATLLFGLTLVLSACSGNVTDSGESQTKIEGNNEQQAAFPRTFVDHKGNAVVIEREPQAIAVGHFSEMEYFFALDKPPVASPLAEDILQEFTVTLGEVSRGVEVADLGDVMSLNLEKLMEVSPDLIIGSIGLHDELYKELQQIAPIVMLDMIGTWDENLRVYASIVGQEEKAEGYIADLKTDIAQAREKLLPLRGETVGFFRFNNKEFGAIGSSHYSYFFDTEEGLGLTAPDNYPEKWQTVSLEGLVAMNPDHLVFLDAASTFEANLAAYRDSAVWNSLRAVQNGNIHFLDLAAATNGPFAIKHAVPSLVESFTN